MVAKPSRDLLRRARDELDDIRGRIGQAASARGSMLGNECDVAKHRESGLCHETRIVVVVVICIDASHWLRGTCPLALLRPANTPPDITVDDVTFQ